MDPVDPEPLITDGRQSPAALAVQRGTCRLLVAHGFSALTEVTLATGRRADIIALGAKGEIWIVEIKSSLEDFRTDRKWPDYLEFCDRFFFATHNCVPEEIFPQSAGLIVADSYGGEILRNPEASPLAPARRKATTLRIAQTAAQRLHALMDPAAGGGLRY